MKALTLFIYLMSYVSVYAVPEYVKPEKMVDLASTVAVVQISKVRHYQGGALNWVVVSHAVAKPLTIISNQKGGRPHWKLKENFKITSVHDGVCATSPALEEGTFIAFLAWDVEVYSNSQKNEEYAALIPYRRALWKVDKNGDVEWESISPTNGMLEKAKVPLATAVDRLKSFIKPMSQTKDE